MESFSRAMIFVGLLLLVLCLISGIVELATIRSIRPPKQKTFNQIRLATTQYHTVIVPAMGALISGVLVSLSASFFYASMTTDRGSLYGLVGFILFTLALVAFAITLGGLLKGVGDDLELASKPVTIRAAAKESALNPRRATLGPEILSQQLDEWNQRIFVHSLDSSAKKSTSSRLDRQLTRAADTHGFWSSISLSLQVYFAAFLRFPFRFGGPLLNFLVLSLSIVWYELCYAGFDFIAPWWPGLGVSLLVGLGLVVTLFYAVTRGNRARLRHLVNLKAVAKAREAIEDALDAYRVVADEEARLRRVLTRADEFFQKEQAARETGAHVLFSLGRLRVSILKDGGTGTSQ